jgi:mRNA interferase YafQ
MLKIKPTNQFKKDLKKFKYNSKVIEELDHVLNALVHGKALSVKYQDHVLSSNWNGHRECHLRPDTLLIYYIDEENKILTLTRIGSHSELFK